MKSAVFCLPLLFFFISVSAAFATFQNNGDGTVTDSQTGLIWQKTPSTETKNWQEALAACADLTLAGQTDWRLPNRNELQSIIDYSWHHPAIDSRSFPDVIGGNFWTSTTNTFASPSYAYTVDFTSGAVSSYDKASNFFQLLAVRGGPQPELEETFFHDNGDGTVTDSRTGLVWLKAPLDADNDGNADAVTWQEALAKAVASISAGFTDWRLPNRNELQSIIDYSWHHPAIDSRSFPDVIGGNFWTSTTNTFASPSYAYTVDFTSGAVGSYDKASNSFQVLFVRGKQHDPVDSSSNFFKFTGVPSAIPAAATENTPFAIEVFANDSSFNGSINLSIQDGGGVNPATVSLVNGHWQGNISVTRPGNTRLIAFYTPLIGDFLSGSSESFYVAEDQNRYAADIQTTIEKKKDIYTQGEDLDYRVYVSNLGKDAASDVIIDISSNGMDISAMSCFGRNGASCEQISLDQSSAKFKASIEPGQYADIIAYGQAKTGLDTIKFSAEAHDINVTDPIATNNIAIAVVNTELPDLPGVQTVELRTLLPVRSNPSSFDTIVLTHGLQSASCNPSELWSGQELDPPQAGSLINQVMGNNKKQINIFQFFWQGACQGSGFTRDAYIAARKNVDFAAQQLSQKLYDKLGSNYDKRIHFIGHSLGTAVNAYAAKEFLTKATKVSKAQVTILDHPNHIGKIAGFLWNDDESEEQWGFDENFFANTLPFDRPMLNLYVDNYYSAYSDKNKTKSGGVGSAINGHVFNHDALVDSFQIGDELIPDESAIFGIDNDHSGVHQWYRWTIRPKEEKNFTGSSVCNDAGTWNGKPEDIDQTLNPCPEKRGGWRESILLHDTINFPAFNGGEKDKTVTTAAASSGNVPHGCTASSSTSVSLACNEATSASASSNSAAASKVASLAAEPQIPKSSIEFTVTVPKFLRYISFDYSFPKIGDGDYVYIFLDGVPVWKMSGDGLTAGEPVSSGLIPVRAAAGQKKLIIALYGVGEQNAQFSLNNFKFTTVADTDSDGVADDEDAFPNNPNEWLDTDRDGIGNNADPDDDNDGIADSKDAFPLDPSEWKDTDGDGKGDNADLDDDNDGIADTSDNCPLVANPNQADKNGDGKGDACDTSPPNTGKWLLPAVLKLLLHR